MAPLVADWKFVGTKKHTQDGSQLVAIMKGIGHGLKPVVAIDVGCGDGIIAFDLLTQRKATSLYAIDISKEAITACEFNLHAEIKNGRAHVKKMSAQTFFRDKKNWDKFDRFVINPPFFVSGSGKANTKTQDQWARHDERLPLKVWANGARRLLKTGGELYCVFPTERLSELCVALSLNNIEPKEVWWFKDDKRRRRFFLRAVRGAKSGIAVHTQA